MSNEPKLPMHEQLLAYAAERRRAGDPPFVLPPGTRRVLLESVDRHFQGGRTAFGTGLRGWFAWTPRWAWAGAVGLLVTGASLVWLNLGSRPADSLHLAKANGPQARSGTVAQSTVTPQDAASASARRLAAPASIPAMPPAASPPVAAAAPVTVQANRSVVLHTGGVASVSANPESARAPARAPAPAPAPADPERMLARYGLRAREASRVFVQVPVTPGAGRAAAPPVAAGVLSRFRLEAVDNRLRLVDADGSVYESGPVGALPVRADESALNAGRTAQRTGAPKRGPGPTPGLAPSGSSAPSSTAVASGGAASLNELWFEAAGTNLTAKRPVRVRGALVLTNQTSEVAPARRVPAGGSIQPLDFWIQNSTVRGEVTVGGGAAVPIYAAPVGRGP